MGNVDPSMFLGMLDPTTQSAAGSTTPIHWSFHHPPHEPIINTKENQNQIYNLHGERGSIHVPGHAGSHHTKCSRIHHPHTLKFPPPPRPNNYDRREKRTTKSKINLLIPCLYPFKAYTPYNLYWRLQRIEWSSIVNWRHIILYWRLQRIEWNSIVNWRHKKWQKVKF